MGESSADRYGCPFCGHEAKGLPAFCPGCGARSIAVVTEPASVPAPDLVVAASSAEQDE